MIFGMNIGNQAGINPQMLLSIMAMPIQTKMIFYGYRLCDQ